MFRGPNTAHGRGIPIAPAPSVHATSVNGIWSWFSDARAVYYNGATYIGWINSSGDAGISKLSHLTGAVTSHTLISSLQIDDHNNVAIQHLPDGRIMAMCSQHNDSNGLRWTVSTNPEDISSWDTVQTLVITPLPATYSNLHYLYNTNKIYTHTRSGGSGSRPMNVGGYDVTTGTWDTQRTWIISSSERPYIKSINNGVDRIDFLFTNAHPDEAPSSIYHVYMQLGSSNEELFYKSDGALIGAGPITPSQATLIYDGTIDRGWVWCLVRGSDGALHAGFQKTVSGDHHYMYSKCVSGVWSTPVDVVNGGTYLYAAEASYSGGIAIDTLNPDRMYCSIKTPGLDQWEIAEFRTADGGATWAKYGDITTSSGTKNCRPVSVKNHNGQVPLVFWSGAYYTFVNYGTTIKYYGVEL